MCQNWSHIVRSTKRTGGAAGAAEAAGPAGGTGRGWAEVREAAADAGVYRKDDDNERRRRRRIAMGMGVDL